MSKLSDIYKAKCEEFKKEFKIKIEVDWDIYKKDKAKKDKDIAPVHIYTDNFIIRSINENDLDKIHQGLWGDNEVMKLYHNGLPRTREQAKEFLDVFTNRWKNNMPYSRFVVHDYNGKFIADVLFGSDMPNSVILGYLSPKNNQGKGYAKEYIGAVVFGWGEHVINNGYNLPDGTEFQRILATSHKDNVPSNKILEGFGFEFKRKEEAYGSMRNHYVLPVLKKQTKILE